MSSAMSAQQVARTSPAPAVSQQALRAADRDSRDPLSDKRSGRGYVELLEPHWLIAIESATD